MPCPPALLYEQVMYLAKYWVFGEITEYLVKSRNIRMDTRILNSHQVTPKVQPNKRSIILYGTPYKGQFQGLVENMEIIKDRLVLLIKF